MLSALGYIRVPADGERWPRVWWCPVGLLASLPLHAAGHHASSASRSQPRAVLDRVVSSYVTTVRGLAYARAHEPGPAADATLIVAVPDAPAAQPLPGVSAEVAALTQLIPGARVLPHPTRQAVLAALPHHPVAHFACHGLSDPAEPAASQLILYDHDTAPLAVADIGSLHLAAGLAYLSACDTTVTNPELTNEAVHITGAFQLAGYQHVIGTLWPVGDFAAWDLAQDFYDQLTHHGTTPPQANLAADALHRATRRLRDRHPGMPSTWAGHIHVGA